MLKRQTILKILSFLVPYLLVLKYDLNHYYLLGGYYWDSGEFAFYASHSTQFLVKASALLHSEPIVRLSIHVTPFFMRPPQYIGWFRRRRPPPIFQ